MPQHTFAVGDLVILDPTWVQPRRPQLAYRVTKLAPVNLTATPVGTAGRPIKGPISMFLPAPPDLAAPALAAEATAPAPFWPGTVVTIAGPGWRSRPLSSTSSSSSRTPPPPSPGSAATAAGSGRACRCPRSPPPPCRPSSPPRDRARRSRTTQARAGRRSGRTPDPSTAQPSRDQGE